MKIILFIVIFCASNLSAQQHYYTFSELKGMEDQSDNTRLFYRLYSYWEENQSAEMRNDIYHFDLGNNVDTVFLSDYSYYSFLSGSSVRVYDLDFWNRNPGEYIYCQASNSLLTESPITEIKRFDGEGGYSNIAGFASAEISKQNDSLVYGSLGQFLKSTDGGRNWSAFGTGFLLIALSPFNDSVLFGLGYNGLLKSENGGNSFFVVDTSISNWPDYDYMHQDILFDKDSLHLYRFFQNGAGYFLSVSDNKGNAFSWTNRYTSSNRIYLSIDYSQSGKIYIAEGRRIYVSDNYGLTFNEYKVLDRKIVGIYKKPNSDKLYAATKYDLYEITPDTTVVIKHLPIDPGLLELYPLAVGNKWIYNYWYQIDTLYETGTSVKKITGDTTVNGKQYFLFNESTNFIRADSVTGKIYKGTFSNNNIIEYLFADLTLDVGDTLYDSTNYLSLTVVDEQPFNQWGLNKRQKFFNDFSTSVTHTFSFVKSIGLYNEFTYELGGGEITLKGAVIDGIIYGDTTVVNVNEPTEQPKEFFLYQNYPNPFNPSTKISWQSPVGSHQTLKVFDVLGREVATLVDEYKDAGSYEVEFQSAIGIRQLASGIYYYQLRVGDYIKTRKMQLLK